MTGVALCQGIGMDVIDMKSKQKIEKNLAEATAKFDALFKETGLSGFIVLVGADQGMSTLFMDKNKIDARDQWRVLNCIKQAALDALPRLENYLYNLDTHIKKLLAKGFH